LSTKSKNIYDFDPLAPAEGAFNSLANELIERGVSVVRGGNTFAVSSVFPWLNLTNAITRAWRQSQLDLLEVRSDKEVEAYWKKAIENALDLRFAPKGVTLYLPSAETAVHTALTPGVGIGGAYHEKGHIIYDGAGKAPDQSVWSAHLCPIMRRLTRKALALKSAFTPTPEKPTFTYPTLDGLGKWANICADVRLEWGLVHNEPLTRVRLEQTQTWIFGLERETRAQGEFASHIAMVCRDRKPHRNAEWAQVQSEYSVTARSFFEAELKGIFAPLEAPVTDIEGTMHLPLVSALLVIEKLGFDPPDDDDGDGPGPQEPKDPKEPPQEPKDPKEPPKEQKPTEGKPKKSERDLASRNPDALDPSSAMKREAEKKVPRSTFISAGNKVIIGKREAYGYKG
jgi:hypothetical protein